MPVASNLPPATGLEGLAPSLLRKTHEPCHHGHEALQPAGSVID
ncbi:hypothetical protein [Ruegeria intermedia]|nr:hypothetical protein [Ruegeria intermedia]